MEAVGRKVFTVFLRRLKYSQRILVAFEEMIALARCALASLIYTTIHDMHSRHHILLKGLGSSLNGIELHLNLPLME